MANPFSGLENIGQSYLQGVQLANQRQAREEAIAQRQEEARVRERYYQDLVDQRREAAALNAKLREEGLATKFGRFLKRNPEGEIDIVGSATAQEEAGNRNQLLETIGFAETQGIAIPGVELTPEERKSQFYNRGRAQGIVQKTKDDMTTERILASQGFFRTGQGPVSTAAVEPMITGQRPETVVDILSAAPQRAPSRSYVERPAAPTPSRASLLGTGAPTSMVPIRINDREYVTRAPVAKTTKAPSLGYETLDLPGGGKARINLTPERLAQIQAQAATLAAGEGEPDLFADLDAAQKQLRDLQIKNVKEFNVEEGQNGQLTVVEDGWFSEPLTPAQVRKLLADERERRQLILKEAGTKTRTRSSVQSQFGPTIMDFEGQSEPESSDAASGQDLPNFRFDVSTGNWIPSR